MLSYSKSHRRNPGKAGQSLLEFALVLPLLLIVVAGVLDLGRVFFATIQVTNAAREGVRYLTRNPDDIGGAINAAENEAQIAITVSVICTDVDGDGCDSGENAIVEATHDFVFVLGFILPSPITISRDATMVVP
jgi:Flp pilus assembly protein TadG